MPLIRELPSRRDDVSAAPHGVAKLRVHFGYGPDFILVQHEVMIDAIVMILEQDQDTLHDVILESKRA